MAKRTTRTTNRAATPKTKGKKAPMLLLYLGIGLVLIAGIWFFERSTKRLSSSSAEVKAGLEQGIENTAASLGNANANEAKGAYNERELAYPTLVEGERLLERMAYTSSYNYAAKQASWVAYRLTPEMLKGTADRDGVDFEPDPTLGVESADPRDYKGSHYDRGHLCPAGDVKFSQEAMNETFYMSNICPQTHVLNRGQWNDLEEQVRKWTKRYNTPLYIATGPIFSANPATIGRNKVDVPSAFYKVIYAGGSNPKMIGFVMPNTTQLSPWPSYVTTVNEVEKQTGLDFYPSLSDEQEEILEQGANLNDWTMPKKGRW